MESFSKIENLEVNYCISASACNDGTQNYLSKMQNINKNYNIYVKKSNRTRWNWIYLKNLIPSNTDWVWLFGDDDIIINQNGWHTINNLINIAENHNADIISIPQAKRIQKEEIYIDSLINLSERFGLHEILGWMTSIIMRRSVFIKFLNTMQVRFQNVYTDRGLLNTRASPFLHSLILLKQNSDSKVIFALGNIVDEQLPITDKASHTLKARQSEFLNERLPYTFTEFKDTLLIHDATRNLSFFRYVNKTFLDLYINIISENILLNRKSIQTKSFFNELLFLYYRLNEESKKIYVKHIEFLNICINSNQNIDDSSYIILKEIFNETKKNYLGNFISDALYNSR
jgi:hypothetical protein